MSLATLKKKTAHKYQNNSVNQSQFSINGGYRNQGYVGQTSDSRTILRTPAKGTESQGHGGCCGTYLRNDVRTSSICSTENNRVIKPSVLGTKGMLQKRTQWARRPAQNAQTLLVKPGDGSHLSSGSDYIVYKRRDTIAKNAIHCYTLSFTVTADASNNDLELYVDNDLIESIATTSGSITNHSHVLQTTKQIILVRFEGTGTAGFKSTISNLQITGVDANLSAFGATTEIDGTNSIYAQYPVASSSKVSKDGIKCCEHIVQIDGVIGALTQGDYIYQRISECTNFDLSYVQYNQTHSLPLNTCHSG